MTRVGVYLSGCGHMDGAEITEAVLTLLHLDRAGAEAVCMALDAPQAAVVDHVSRRPAAGATRNCLQEAARIARGRIKDAAKVTAAELDAVIFPGGFGAARNLCDFATAGAAAKPHPQVARLVQEMWSARKPIGAICIAPALIAACLAGKATGVNLTIGDDPATAGALRDMGCRHTECKVTAVTVDPVNRIVTTPAYMFDDARPSQVSEGIDQLVRAVLALTRS